MVIYSRQLLNGRWGIYIDDRLVASVGCSKTCQEILKSLESRLSSEDSLTFPSETETIVEYFKSIKLVS